MGGILLVVWCSANYVLVILYNCLGCLRGVVALCRHPFFICRGLVQRLSRCSEFLYFLCHSRQAVHSLTVTFIRAGVTGDPIANLFGNANLPGCGLEGMSATTGETCRSILKAIFSIVMAKAY